MGIKGPRGNKTRVLGALILRRGFLFFVFFFVWGRGGGWGVVPFVSLYRDQKGILNPKP